MGKSKIAAKPVKAEKATAPAKVAAATKSKGAAVATKKGDKKKVQEPESSDESADDSDDSEESADSESSEDDSEVETTKPAAKANGKANGKTNGKAKDDSSDEDSEDSDSSEDEPAEKPKAAVNGKAKTNGAAAKKAADSDDSESDEEDSDDSEESDSEEATPAKAAAADSDDSDDSDDSEESEEEEKPVSKKRKAEDDATPQAKKQKSEVEDDGTKSKNLFVGSLSWNVDDEWLKSEFEKFGEVMRANVMTDRATGRSKGFGYVEFTELSDAIKAHDGMKGQELDGRPLNVDYSKPRDQNSTPNQRSNDRAKTYGDTPSEPSDTLFVGNISWNCDETIVGDAFGQHGTVLGVRLPTDPESGRMKGFGYVQFASVEEATAANTAMNGEYVGDRAVRTDFSQPRQQNSDRGGGRGRGGDRGGRGRGGFGDRGGRGGGRGRGGDRGGRGNFSTNRGGFGAATGKKVTF